MKIIKEIKLIGIKDWLWFNIILKRNEFHRSLNKIPIEKIFYIFNDKITIEQNYNIINRRHKAHIIDEKLENLNLN